MSQEINQITTSWHSYPKIYALGHRAIADIFKGAVVVEEKIDGSQFSFGRFNGELKCRSKGVQLNVAAPEKMFSKAVEVAASLDLQDGFTYRAEYLQSPKHNTLAYSRIPSKHLIIFDINDGHEKYQGPVEKRLEAERIGLECVPMFTAPEWNAATIVSMLAKVSCLGGQLMEGVVVKNYDLFGTDGKVLMGKYVSESFKEVHSGDWKERNPGQLDILDGLVQKYKTPARWNKAVQHLKEAGQLEGSPRDIAALLKEVSKDTQEECAAEIKEALMKWAWGKIQRGIISGLPEWYKEQLLNQQFDNSKTL